MKINKKIREFAFYVIYWSYKKTDIELKLCINLITLEGKINLKGKKKKSGFILSTKYHKITYCSLTNYPFGNISLEFCC